MPFIGTSGANADAVNAAVRAAKASVQRNTLNPSMTYGTQGLAYYLPDQFILDAVDSQPLLSRTRTIFRDAISGEIDKMMIASHIMQAKQEGEKVNSTGVTITKVPYLMKYTSSLWDISQEARDANIAQEQLSRDIFTMHSRQYGSDNADLALNGDEELVVTSAGGASEEEKAEDAKTQAFYRINDGWIKQAEASGNAITDAKTINWDVMHDIYGAIPSRYMSSSLCWVMSPWMYNEWHRYATNSANGGGNISLDIVNKPLNFEIIMEPKMPKNKIMLVDPKNLIQVTNRNPVFKMTAEGMNAIQRNVVYHAIHSCSDFIIEEPKALAIASNVTPA